MSTDEDDDISYTENELKNAMKSLQRAEIAYQLFSAVEDGDRGAFFSEIPASVSVPGKIVIDNARLPNAFLIALAEQYKIISREDYYECLQSVQALSTKLLTQLKKPAIQSISP